MNSLLIIFFLASGLIIYGILEYRQHQKYLQSIPIRIHVNGTRGKSSVTRLIGAGLRAGGYSTITKVTGTFPRMILSDGIEVAIHRKEKANILEQLKIVKYSSKQKADVLLIECMALQPEYQRITEQQMIKSTHGVLTNIRMDHLDVMGPRLENVAEALTLTIPRNAKIFTAEQRMLDYIEKKAGKLNTEVIASDGNMVSIEEMRGFDYFEHPENVALAISVCQSLNVERDRALAAMKKTLPDEGALRKYKVRKEGKSIIFYNALAANDPESSIILWKNIRELEGNEQQYMIIMNSRKDRKERSMQLVMAFSSLTFDHLFLTGENVDLVGAMARRKGINEGKIHLIGLKEPQRQADEIIDKSGHFSVVVAFGNMGAGGAELAKYFEQISEVNNHD